MRYIFVTAGIIVIVGLLAGLKVGQIKTLIDFGQAAAASGTPPEVVGTMAAKQETWENRLFSVGTITPARGVIVSSEMPGVVRSIPFDSGQHVQAGQVLVEMDHRVELAEFHAAQERERLARITYERSNALFRGKAVSKAQLDTDESSWRAAAATVAALKAQIGRKVVRAPFAGRVGIRMVNVGQFVNPGMPITQLESEEENFVDFTLPQDQIERLEKGMSVRINGNTAGPQADGAIAAIAPAMDPVARSGRVRATITRTKDNLSPGMFVNVAVVLPEKRDVAVVAATAVVHASYGDSLFLVEKQTEKGEDKQAAKSGPPGAPVQPAPLIARQQFVRTGETRGDFVEIIEGIKAGQEVVSAGAFKLRNGAPIAINNSVRLNPEIAPRPENR